MLDKMDRAGMEVGLPNLEGLSTRVGGGSQEGEGRVFSGRRASPRRLSQTTASSGSAAGPPFLLNSCRPPLPRAPRRRARHRRAACRFPHLPRSPHAELRSATAPPPRQAPCRPYLISLDEQFGRTCTSSGLFRRPSAAVRSGCLGRGISCRRLPSPRCRRQA